MPMSMGLMRRCHMPLALSPTLRKLYSAFPLTESRPLPKMRLAMFQNMEKMGSSVSVQSSPTMLPTRPMA